MILLPKEASKGLEIWTPHLNEEMYTKKSRKIWTRNGEYDVPMKKKKDVHPAFRGIVKDIWFKDEKGDLLLYDPIGEENTITNGAIYNIMQYAWGYWSNTGNVTFGSSVSGNYGIGVAGPWYNDGTYNFPNINDLNAMYTGSSTMYTTAQQMQLANSLFGNLWFLSGTSGGLTGSHIASSQIQAGFYTYCTTGSNNVTGNGWFGDTWQPTSGSTNASISDSVSNATTATPQITHTMTLSLNASATSMTFDGICWLPQNAYARSSFGSGSGASTSWFQGAANTSSEFHANGNIGQITGTSLLWGVASTSPTTMANLMVSALWNPGYSVTLNASGSWGFTYAFQG